MGLTETSIALALYLLVLMIAVLLDRRPYRPGKRNSIWLMIITLAARRLVLGRQDDGRRKLSHPYVLCHGPIASVIEITDGTPKLL